MTEDELQQLLDKTLPAADRHEVFVEECQDQDVRLRFSLKPGETWSRRRSGWSASGGA